MKLKKLLKKIDKDTYVSIEFDGERMCACKVPELENKFLECNNKVESVGIGIVDFYERGMCERFATVNINCICKE